MLKTEYGKRIDASLTKAAISSFVTGVARYCDRNAEAIKTLDLSLRYSFGDKDRELLFSTINVSLDEMKASIKASKYIENSNKIQSNPFYIASMLAVSTLLGRKDTTNSIVFINYFSLMMWTSMHSGFFKYGANKQIMDYTISHLPDTFQIRSCSSGGLYEFINKNTVQVLETYNKRIIQANDPDLTWVVDAIWTRLKGKIKKIAERYYDNHKSGRYLNNQDDNYTEEDYHIADNVSFATDRLVNKTYQHLLSREYNRSFIQYSIRNADTSQRIVELLIEDIISDDSQSERLRNVINAMITIYVVKSGNPIEYVGRGDYINFMSRVFSSNTTDKEMEFIKDSIDVWLDENMVKYGRAHYGTTARNQYRRVIYMFLVHEINFNAKVL